MLSISYWSPEAKKNVPEIYWPESLAKKKTTIINLTGNTFNDKISLQYAQVLLGNWKRIKMIRRSSNFISATKLSIGRLLKLLMFSKR